MGFGNFFKRLRKEDTVIDLGDMQRRGILKKKEDTNKVMNLTENESALGFLGSLAGASTSETTEKTLTGSYGYSSAGKQKLKGILGDMKSRIDNTYDKVYKLSDRIDLLEKKLERLERRAGYGQ